MAKLESREFKTGDEFGIVSLYNHITGRHRSVEQHRWEWLEVPEGPASIWVILESDSRNIVGHHGLMPISIDFFGKTLLAGKTENTILHEKYAGTGIYILHEKRFLQEAKKKFDLLFTNLAAGTPEKIRRKFGYKPVGSYANYLKINHREGWKTIVDYFFNNRLSKLPLNSLLRSALTNFVYLCSIVFQKKTKIDKDITFHAIRDPSIVEQELNSFWQHLKGTLGITIDRTFKYLQWRIFNNPYVSYDFLLARNKGNTVGYVITQTLEKPIQKGVIVDLVCKQGNETVFNTILFEAIRRFKDLHVNIVHFPTLASKNFLNECLLKNGFIPAHRFRPYLRRLMKQYHEDPILLLKTINLNMNQSNITSPKNWYYTDLFKEGIQ